MGVEKIVNERVIILENAKFDYTPDQIQKFIRLWNEGWSLDWLATKMHIAKYEVLLLTIHCDLEGLIGEREGGYMGTIKKERKKREKMVIEYKYQDKRMNYKG